MKKKSIKMILLSLGVVLVLMLLLPSLFKGRIAESVRQQINKQVNATVDFGNAELLLLRNFPSLSLEVDDLSIINKEPFAGDTLFFAKRVFIDMPWKSLFAGGVDPYKVSHFVVQEAQINLISDQQGQVNYDIGKNEGDGSSSGDSSPAVLTLEKYEFEDVSLVYEDRKEGLYVKLDSLFHKGSGDLSSSGSVLNTQSSTLVTLVSEGATFLDKNPVDWKAAIEMDLDFMRFTFKENVAHINRLPLVFEGSVALPEEGVDVDLQFHTPTSAFKQFLSLIPETYSGSLEGIDTRGNFSLNGVVKGMLTEERIPLFEIDMAASDAYFKYEAMPLAMEEINFSSKLANTTAVVEDTYMQIDTLHFKLAGDPMDVSMLARELGGNPRVDLDAKGVLNLGNFARLMPSGAVEGLQGIMKIALRSHFDLKSVEDGAYDMIDNQGDLKIDNMRFSTEFLPEEVLVEKAELKLNSRSMQLNSASIRTGKSDMVLSGKIDDYLNAITDDGVVKGKLFMNAGHLEVADLMKVDASEDEVAENTRDDQDKQGEKKQIDEEALLPGNLDLLIEGKAGQVVYDGIELNNAKTKMHLSEQRLEIEELSSEVFGGRVSLDGTLAGATSEPDYKMNIRASQFDLASAFAEMDLLKALMPIARAFEGQLNGSINIAGLLDGDLSPVLTSLTGSMKGGVQIEEVKKGQLGVVQSLNNNFSLVDLTKLAGKELAGKLEFQEGKVALDPVSFSLNGMEATLGGVHQFNGSMDYTLTLQVPASYLGKEVNKLASSLNIKDLDKRKIPVDVLIGGALKQPVFSTNLDKATANFVAQLSREQKEQLLQKGKDELSNLVNQALGGKKDSLNSTTDKTDAVKEAAGSLLNNLFKKKKDTTRNQ